MTISPETSSRSCPPALALMILPSSPHGAHVVVGHVTGGEHAVQRPVLVGHREDGDAVRLHDLPGSAQGGGGRQGGRRIVVQVPHLVANVRDEHGRLKPKAVQNDLGLVADLAQAGGLVLPLAQGVFQGGVGHGRHDGVGVRVAVSCNINGIHAVVLLYMKGHSLFIMIPGPAFVNGPFRKEFPRKRLLPREFFPISDSLTGSAGPWGPW